MIIEYEGASLEGPSKRRYNDSINLDVLHDKLCLLALIYSILCDIRIKVVPTELIANVLLGVFEHLLSILLL